jgi:hypothetical protein
MKHLNKIRIAIVIAFVIVPLVIINCNGQTKSISSINPIEYVMMPNDTLEYWNYDLMPMVYLVEKQLGNTTLIGLQEEYFFYDRMENKLIATDYHSIKMYISGNYHTINYVVDNELDVAYIFLAPEYDYDYDEDNH